jgi:hypothetical protein
MTEERHFIQQEKSTTLQAEKPSEREELLLQQLARKQEELDKAQKQLKEKVKGNVSVHKE